MDIIKFGSLELTIEEIKQIIAENKYICRYSGIYKIIQTKENFKLQKVVNCKNFAPRGRFCACTKERINKVLGYAAIL